MRIVLARRISLPGIALVLIALVGQTPGATAAAPAGELRIAELAGELAAVPGEIPAGAETWSRCERPEPAVLKVKRGVPEVPSARVRRQFGTVIVFAEVGKDGALHDLAFFQGVHAMLNATVRDAVKDWEYSPATCSGQSVPQRIFLAVQFRP